MTKKILAVVLAVVMAMSVLCINVAAADEYYLGIQVFTQDTVGWGYHGFEGKWGEVKNDGKDVTLTFNFTGAEDYGLTKDNANADHPPVFSIQIDAPRDMFDLPEDAATGDTGSSANYEINVTNIVVSAEGYDDVKVADSKNSGTFTIEKTQWGTGGTNITIALYDTVVKQLGIDTDTFVAKYMPALRKITATFNCPKLEKVVEDEPAESGTINLITDGIGLTGTDFKGPKIAWNSAAIDNTCKEWADFQKALKDPEAKFVLTYTITGEPTGDDYGWFNFFMAGGQAVPNYSTAAAEFVDVVDGVQASNQWSLLHAGKHVVTYSLAKWQEALEAAGATDITNVAFQSGLTEKLSVSFESLVVVTGGTTDKPSEDEPSEDEPEVPSDAKIPSGYKAIKTITGGKVTFPEDEYNKGSANGTLVTLVQSEYNLTEDDYIYFSITPSANLTKYKVAGQVQNTSWGSDWQGVTGGDNVNSVGFYLKDVLAINPSVPLAQLQQVLLQVWDGEIGDSVEDYTVVIARKSEEPSKPTTTVETEIEADVKNCSDELTIIKLPETVANGETIKLHVKGSSKGDFRMWLAGGQTTLCADPQWKASEQLDDYTAFDFTVELTCAPQNAGGAAGTADGILFKGPSYGVNLDGLTIDYIAIVTEVEVEQPTTKVEEVSYSMEKTGGDQFEDKSLAGGLNLEKDAEYGLCRIASSWVGGGSVYNAIIAALQSSDGGNLKITYTGDFEGLTFQADGIESTLAPEDFTITYVGNNNVASIPVADVLKAFAEGIAADSWKNIVLNYGDQLTLYAFEITTFKEVVIDEPTDTTDNTPFGYAIQTGNNKYHGFRIGPFMISMPHRFVNGICPICHQRAPKTTDVSSLIEADEDEAETVSEPAPKKPTYEASEDALYVLETTGGQNFEDVTIAGGAELVTSDGRTRLATSWVNGGTVYNDLIKALQDNEDAVIKITYTGTITAFGIESENAGIIDVECEVTEGDEFNTMTCNVADFLETAKKAIEDTSWRNVYLVAEDGAVLYGFEIVAAE